MQLKKRRMTASFTSEYCCRYDECLTLESSPWELAEMFGYSKEEMEDLCRGGLLNLVPENERRDLIENIHSQLLQSDQIELIFHGKKKDGTDIWILNRGCIEKEEDGQFYMYGVLVDFTWSKYKYDKEKEAKKALQEQVGKDSLTNIYNANTARKLAEEYFAKAGQDRKCALLIIDLDDFKKVNDTYGHEYGDKLIQNGAAILKRVWGSEVTYRIGGDEFVVVCPDMKVECARERISLFEEAIEDYNRQNTCKELYLQMAIGMEVYSSKTDKEYMDVFRRADSAMYEDKKQKKM